MLCKRLRRSVWATLAVVVVMTIRSTAIYAHDSDELPIHMRFSGCTPATHKLMISTLERLPRKLLSPDPLHLEVSCVSEALPYGFKVEITPLDTKLTLGALSEITEKRARYRIAHLNSQEQQALWHTRGLVHLLTLKSARSYQWHLRPQFRAANGWNEAGDQALNQDAWGYSRALGRQSALYDFVTFAEEWFVRAPRRETSPDNRVECQSLTKGRVMRRLFEPNLPDQPPQKCTQFDQWSRRFTQAEVLFTNPTSSPISSFGHLAILLRTTDAQQPDYHDLVLQYVGLLDDSLFRQLRQVFSNDIPMILNMDFFISFDHYTRYREDRAIQRYQVILDERQFTWLKARLWEQLRRFESRYRFTTENCAQQVLRLFQSLSTSSDDQASLKQLGLTTSPVGAISVLQHQAVVARSPRRLPSLSEELALHYTHLVSSFEKVQALLKDDRINQHLIAPLSPQTIDAWRRLVEMVSERPNVDVQTQSALIDLIHNAQDFYDLSGWLAPVEAAHPIPVRVQELLTLKHDLFHEEKSAQAVVERLKRWDQEHPLSPRPRSQNTKLADLLVPLLSDLLDQLPDLDETINSSEDQPQHQLSEPAPVGWGADGSLTLSGVRAMALNDASPTHTSSHTHSINMSATLYDERQGIRRSELQIVPRDLQILELSVSQELTPRGSGAVKVTPVHLAQRRGIFGLSRIGALIDLTGYGVWRQAADPLVGAVSLEGRLGMSLQVLHWWQQRGDLTLGLQGWGRVQANHHAASSLIYGWLTIPISDSSLMWFKSEYDLIHTRLYQDRWSGTVTAAWRVALDAGASAMILLGVGRELARGHVDDLKLSLGVRLQ